MSISWCHIGMLLSLACMAHTSSGRCSNSAPIGKQQTLGSQRIPELCVQSMQLSSLHSELSLEE